METPVVWGRGVGTVSLSQWQLYQALSSLERLVSLV